MSAELVLVWVEVFLRTLVKTDLFFKFFSRNETSAALAIKNRRWTRGLVAYEFGQKFAILSYHFLLLKNRFGDVNSGGFWTSGSVNKKFLILKINKTFNDNFLVLQENIFFVLILEVELVEVFFLFQRLFKLGLKFGLLKAWLLQNFAVVNESIVIILYLSFENFINMTIKNSYR